MEQHHHLNQEQHHEMHSTATADSDVRTTVSYQNKIIRVQIENKQDHTPLVLMPTHGKLMHLIVVSEDLQEYYHLHPVQVDDFTFIQELALTGHVYKAFVDIKPKDQQVMIEPHSFTTGSELHQTHTMPALEIDRQLSKEIQGIRLEFIHESLETGKNIKLTFDIKNATPEPYLGALGHVVILDEKVEHFIHVHPISDSETVFEAHFEWPGIYKLWAEFQFDGEVAAFPYVIEVK